MMALWSSQQVKFDLPKDLLPQSKAKQADDTAANHL
jgi:hypothetical protein